MPLDDLGLAPAAEPTPSNDPTARINYGDFELTHEQALGLATFLSEQIAQSEADTAEFREALRLWRLFLDPKNEPKDFPWENASNIFVPIPRTVIDAFKASVKQTVTKQQRQFVAEIDAAHAGIEESEVARAQEAAVRAAEIIAEPAFLDLKRFLDEEIEELLVAGFGPIRLTVERDERKVYTAKDRVETIVFRAGPKLTAAPVDTWVWPAGLWRSVQEMPWVGHWVNLTPAALRLRAASPWNYKNVEEALAARDNEIQVGERGRLEATMQAPSEVPLRTYEVTLVWSFDGTDYHDILVTLNTTNRLLHRVIYNPVGDGQKPYDVEVCSPRVGTIFARGIIEPIVQPCRAINTAVNQTFDAQTLANAPSLLYPEGSAAAEILKDGFAPGLPLPYKESKDEIGVLKFPDPSATSFQMVEFFLTIIERLTRIGPNRLGEISSGKRTPASLGLATQQLGAELLDELIDRLRDTIGRLWARAFRLYYEEDRSFFVKLLGEADGELITRIIERTKASQKSVQEVLNLRLYASSSTRSVELERQNAMAVAQLSFGAFKQMIELVQLYFNPQAPPQAREVLLDVLKSSQEQLRRIVELSNQPDAATIIPDFAARLEAAPPPQAPVAPAAAEPPPSAAALSPDVLASLGGGGAAPPLQ